MGRDFDRPFPVGNKTIPLWERIEKTTFPGFQGTPHLNNIAAKAVFFKEMLSTEYKNRQTRIVENAKVLAEEFVRRGYDILTGGTENHLILANVANLRRGLTGLTAQKSLEDCGIIVNMNRLPYDPQNARITSGMRIGTPIVTRNGMRAPEMRMVAQLVDQVLTRVEIVNDREYRLDPAFRDEMREQIHRLCSRFPMQ
jgi:glycine hydroxymethyltransferase